MGVKLRKRGSIWWVYIDWQGQRMARSLRVKDRRTAEKAARQIRQRLATGDASLFSSATSPTFSEYASGWLERANGRLRASTMEDYRLGVSEASEIKTPSRPLPRSDASTATPI